MTALASAWLGVLRAAVARTNQTEVATRLGISRTTLSLVLSGKYPAKTFDAIEQKVRDTYEHWLCPELGVEIAGVRCVAYRTRPMPRSSARDLRHWRACKTCPHNPDASHV